MAHYLLCYSLVNSKKKRKLLTLLFEWRHSVHFLVSSAGAMESVRLLISISVANTKCSIWIQRSPPKWGIGNGIKMQFNQIADADVVVVVVVAIVLNLNNFLSLSLILFGCFFFLDNFCVKCSLLFSLDFLLSCIVVLRFFMEPVSPSVFSSFFLRGGDQGCRLKLNWNFNEQF